MNAVATLVERSFTEPTETRSFPDGRLDLPDLGGGALVGRFILEPGWRWSRCVRPTAGTRPASSRTSGTCCPVGCTS